MLLELALEDGALTLAALGSGSRACVGPELVPVAVGFTMLPLALVSDAASGRWLSPSRSCSGSELPQSGGVSAI